MGQCQVNWYSWLCASILSTAETSNYVSIVNSLHLVGFSHSHTFAHMVAIKYVFLGFA